MGLIGAMGGIATGCCAFHRPVTTSIAAEPVKASDRAVDDAIGSPDAQRGRLAK